MNHSPRFSALRFSALRFSALRIATSIGPAAFLISLTGFIAGVPTSRAALLPTEIYYNGPLAGADADEFVELANSGNTSLQLNGFRFETGLGLTFPNISLAPGESLVVAPNPDGFLGRFATYGGLLFDATGGLSNSGEALALVDADGAAVFSLTYDDRGDWPESADGAGDSLQLRAGTTTLADPASWQAGPPSPGLWAGSGAFEEHDGDGSSVRRVPLPSSLGLVLAGLLLLGAGCTARRVIYLAPLHTISLTAFPREHIRDDNRQRGPMPGLSRSFGPRQDSVLCQSSSSPDSPSLMPTWN